ncbi:MAG: hypothetical protein Q8K99_08330 [Actinomycetota bacterium]|nr:hypothetical protein [Actinomycetota bacterium]
MIDLAASWSVVGVFMLGTIYFWSCGVSGHAVDIRWHIVANGMFVLGSGLVILVRQTRLRRYHADKVA